MTSFQGADSGQSRQTPASTTSLHQRRSLPLAAQIIPGHVRYAISPVHHATGPGDRIEPPSPIGSVNRQTILHQITPQYDRSRSQSVLLRDRVHQMTTALDSIPHPARPRVMSLDSFQMTPELIAEISLAHDMSQGMAGVAYAGGALSGPVSRSTPLGPSSLPNESTLERVRSGKSLYPSQAGETTRVQSRNAKPCSHDHQTWGLHSHGSVMREPPQSMLVQQPSPTLEIRRPNSLEHLPSLSDPCHPASYNPVDRELRSALATAPLPSLPVPQDVSCTEPLRSTPHSVARIPDKSFPIQEESPTASSSPAAAPDRGCPHSLMGPQASHCLPESSILPDPHSYIITTSPSPIVTGVSREKGKKPVLLPYSPVQSVDSPYPVPFEHIHRRSNASPDNETMGNPQIDSNSAREQLALRMQTFALNNGGMVSDSTLSPSSTPFPGPQYNPWTFSRTYSAFSRKPSGIADEQASTRSSPSHQPVSLPPFRGRDRRQRRRERSQELRHHLKTYPPRRAESTQPRDTSSELLSGEETSVESTIGERQSEKSAPQPVRRGESTDDEEDAKIDDGRWIDEDLEDECGIDCLLHPGDAKKHRRRWKLRWAALLRDVRASATFAAWRI